MTENPFVWEAPLTNPADVVGRDEPAAEVARGLAGGRQVAVVGSRGAGRTTFAHRLRLELEAAAPDVAVRVVGLRGVLSAAALGRRLAGPQAPAGGLVLVLDDADHLHRCGRDPVSILRSAAEPHPLALVLISTLATPLLAEGVCLRLPQIGREAFLGHLAERFTATGKPADPDALAYLLDATGGHPRSTQRLAADAWAGTAAGEHVTLGGVIYALDRLVEPVGRPEFTAVCAALAAGDDGEVNEARTLQLLADRGSGRLTSRPAVARYGLSSHSRVRPALQRLARRGLVEHRDGAWGIVDPLFAEWLRRSSPLTERDGAPLAAD